MKVFRLGFLFVNLIVFVTLKNSDQDVKNS